EVMAEPEDAALPATIGPWSEPWERLLKLMHLAREVETVAVPRALDDVVSEAVRARDAGRPLPSLAPVRREIVRGREQIAWGARQAGYTQWRIALALGISQPAVSKILRRVERRVLAGLEADVRAVKLKQSLQLEFIVDQALRAWKG